MRGQYIDFISKLSEKYSPIFGNIWWYSLIHEKNTTKSMAYHNLVKGKISKPFSIWKALYLGFRKYLSFIFRHLLFRHYEAGMISRKNLFISYNFNHMMPFDKRDGDWVYLPQKDNWKDLYKQNEIVVDSFISKEDLWKLFWRYLLSIGYNWGRIFDLKKEFKGDFNYKIFKEEIWRSFIGDVLIEGLFFEMAFKNMASELWGSGVDKIFYPYEGQAWEKALCKAFSIYNFSIYKSKVIALLCSCPSLNILNYWYDNKEIDMMPTPDKLGVFGKTTYNLFKPIYGDIVFINGPMRFRGPINKVNTPGIFGRSSEFIFVALSSNTKQAYELIDWVLENRGTSEIIFKTHPQPTGDSLNLIKIENKGICPNDDGHIVNYLKRSKELIVVDSSILLIGKALGIRITIPDLDSFVSMEPYVEDFDDYFSFDLDERGMLVDTPKILAE